MTAPAPCFVGLMSGTSGDGVDGVLARFSGAGLPEVLAHVHRPFDPSLRQELLALNRSGPDELHRAARAAIGVSTAYAAVVRALLQQADVSASTVCALGAHGQTVRHQPSPQPAEPKTACRQRKAGESAHAARAGS